MWTNRGMGGAGAGGRRAAFCCSGAGTGILLVISLVGAAGCGGAPAPPAAPPPVRLTPVDHAGLLREVNEQRGKVVVLDCWSTSCPPCVKEFPRLVALEARYRGRVACLSLAFDFEGLGTVEQAAGRVEAFLRQADAGRIVNLLSAEEADVMYRKLELDSVPAVYVWRADGSLARRFDAADAAARLGRPFTYDDVELEVRALLGP
ncbi:MAG: TlpA family protein disulfide reductase [Planctomycetia bacterium]|jgi:thiol-disulfide isomerase/thioredoxin